jgi:hypothetical protein
MKNTTSIVITVLLIITTTQWALINYLLLQKQNQIIDLPSNNNLNTNDSSLPLQIVSIPSADVGTDATRIETTDTETNAIDQSQPKYEGVAATLMINAPKWFQKRYSTMLSNIYTNTPSNWAIQIFYISDETSQSQFGLHINPNLARLNLTNERIIFTPIPNELVLKYGQKKKLLYWTDEWLWKNLVSDDVLVFNGNGVICSNAHLSLLDGSAYDELFQHVDYVGSPWRSMYGEGGDGSFSYRSRTAMLNVLRYKPYKLEYGREDQYFLNNLKEMNKLKQAKNKINKAKINHDGSRNEEEIKLYRIATKEQTHLFAGNLDSFTDDGSDPPPLPMVVSGTMGNLDHDVRQNVLTACPELGMMFPLLHHPSCFGAHPDGEECGRHICALKDKSERKSGC